MDASANTQTLEVGEIGNMARRGRMKRDKGVTLRVPYLHNIKQNAEYLPNNQQQSSPAPTLILNQVKNKSTEQAQYHLYF